MDELIKRQEEVVAALQAKVLKQVGNNSPVPPFSEALSRAVEDLNTLRAVASSRRGK